MNTDLTNATIALVIVTGCLVVVAVAALVVNVVQAVGSGKAVKAATAATVAATRQAEASEKLAAASARQAEATEKLVEEQQRTRGIEWQPLLNNEGKGTIWNTGRGHAYRTVLVVQAIHGLAVSRPPFLVGAQSHNTIPPLVGVEDPGGVIPDDADWGIFCLDQFGNRYRFLDRGQPPDAYESEDSWSVVRWDVVWSLSDPKTI